MERKSCPRWCILAITMPGKQRWADPYGWRTSEPGVACKLQANERPAVRADSTRGMTPWLTSSLHLHVLVSTHAPVHHPFAYAHKHILMWTHMYLFTLLHSTRKKLIGFPWVFPEKQLPTTLCHSYLRKWRPADGSKLWRHLNDNSCPQSLWASAFSITRS